MTARRLVPSAVLGLVGLLAACAHTTGIDPTVHATTGTPNAELALRRSLNQVDAAMRDLGGSVSPVAFGGVGNLGASGGLGWTASPFA